MAGGDRRSGIARLFAAGLIGAGAGLLAGGRAIKTYDWRTEWFVPAPRGVVYEAMTSREALRSYTWCSCIRCQRALLKAARRPGLDRRVCNPLRAWGLV